MNLYDFLKSKFPEKKFYEVNAQNFQPANYNDDLDHRCHEEVNKEVYNQEIDFLLMPLSLTENFVELSGLILAHHIRLSHKKYLREVPIIVYGYVDQIKLLKLSSYARILLTDNVHYVNLLNYDFENIAESINKYNLKPFDLNNFPKTIEILPPANYDSHHSIDNEYALIRWSKYIGCYEELPKQFRKEFDSRLYFKYLNVKNKVVEFNDKKNYSIALPSKTKILLIDDEEQKGWGKFYESFFQYSPNIEFICSGIDFKNNQNQTETIDKINEIVKKEDPDVVLLDLRLLDNDFEELTAPEELTGIKAIEAIKAINRGIQIIVTTASNKAWNFNLAKQKGAYDFIIKDGFDDPEKSIKRLKEFVEVCCKRAKFLKDIHIKISEIKNIIKNNSYTESEEDIFRNTLYNNLDLGFELLDKSIEITGVEKYISFAYLQFFLLIEEYVKTKSNHQSNPILREENMQILINYAQNKDVCIAKKDKENKWISKLQFIDGKYSISNEHSKIKTDTNFFVSSILIYFFGNVNSSVNNWTELYKLRNDIAHNISTRFSLDKIQILLNFIKYIFDINKQKDCNVSKGFPIKTFEESIEELKKKFSKE